MRRGRWTGGKIHRSTSSRKFEQNPDLRTFVVDPLGAQGWLRPNFLHPPFNNKKARQALLHMVDQETYLAWAIGQPQYYRACYSVFACGGPYETRIGAAPIVEHDLARARQLVQELGYDGQPLVVLHVTDRQHMNAAAIVTHRRLEFDRLQSHFETDGLVDVPSSADA